VCGIVVVVVVVVVGNTIAKTEQKGTRMVMIETDCTRQTWNIQANAFTSTRHPW